MSTFGDIEPDDVWDAEPTIAPEQVTHRLHDLRIAIDELAGRDPTAWDDLSDAEQALAAAIGDVIVDWITLHAGDDTSADVLAEQLHNVRVWLARGLIAAWADLTDDERTVGVEIMAMILDWLHREGPR